MRFVIPFPRVASMISSSSIIIIIFIIIIAPRLARPLPHLLAQDTALLRLDSRRLEIELFPATSSATVEAWVSIESLAEEPLSEVTLYLTGLAEIVAVSGADWTELPYRRHYSSLPQYARLTVLFAQPVPRGSLAEITVRYRLRLGPARLSGSLLPGNTLVSPGNSYFIDPWYPTLRPVLDLQGFLGEPEKVQTELEVIAPESELAISCGYRYASRETSPVGNRITLFEMAEILPISVPLVVGDYQRRPQIVGGIPLSFYLSPAARAAANEVRLLEIGELVARTVRNNERWFGALPRDEIVVVLGSFGRVAWGYPHLLLLPDTFLKTTLDLTARNTICHEISHTWFGNAVTGVGPGGNEWLNEGLASWISSLHIEEIYGRQEALALMRSWRGKLFDSKSPPVPIVELRPSQNTATQEGYLKGALVFEELRTELGLAELVEALRTVQQRHRGGMITLLEFEREISAATGRDLAPFFDQWLRSTRMPDYEIAEWRSSSGAATNRVVLTVINRGDGEGLVPIEIRSADDERFRALISVPPAGRATIAWEVPFTPTRIEVDPDRTALCGYRWRSFLGAARRRRGAGDSEEAGRLLEEILRRAPDQPEVWYQLGRAHQDGDLPAAALQAYARVLELAPAGDWTRPWARIRRAEIRIGAGLATEAREELRLALGERSQEYGAHDHARRILQTLGQP